MKNILKLVLIVNILFTTSQSNADPTVKVTINHPPGLGLKVNKVAFNAAGGECSDQIIQAIIADMVSNQIEVIDRAHLNSILEEHNLTLSGYIDGSSAAAIGKILGPSALIFVNVQRCTTTNDRLYEDRSFYNYSTSSTYTKRFYIAKTRAFLKASIQTVDLATGKIFAAQAIDYSPYNKNESEQGYPEFPSSFDVMDYAMRLVVNRVHNMFLPWKEVREMVFFDDHSHGLREAAQAMQASDIERAFTLTKEIISTCISEGKSDGKIISHAYYNMGVIYVVQNEIDSALLYFRRATQAKPEQLYNEAIAECIKTKEINTSMQKYETRSIEMPNENNNASNNISSMKNNDKNNVLTNNDIILLTKNKMSNMIIIQKIKSSKCNFNTNSNGLIELTKAGVNDEIIKTMMEKN